MRNHFLVLALTTFLSLNATSRAAAPSVSTTPTAISWLVSSIQQCALAPTPTDIDLEEVTSATVVTAHYAHGGTTDASVTLTSGNPALDQRVVDCVKTAPAGVVAAISESEKVAVPVFWETPAKLIAAHPELVPAMIVPVAPFATVTPRPCDRLYPPEAVRSRQEGITHLKITAISPGTVTKAEITQSSGYELLDKAAVACAKLQTYRPYGTIDPARGIWVEVIWSLVKPGPLNIDAMPGPPGWLQKVGAQADFVGWYQWPEAEGTFHQFITAGVYATEETLDQYAAGALPGAPSHLVDEKWSTVCGSEPSFEEEYSGGIGPGRSIIDEVVFIKNHLAYVATYVRREPDMRRADAYEWIHSFCKHVP